jgi:hypothetical protein
LFVALAFGGLAAGVAAMVFGLERLRGRQAPQHDQAFLFVCIILMVIAGIFVFFYGR